MEEKIKVQEIIKLINELSENESLDDIKEHLDKLLVNDLNLRKTKNMIQGNQ